MSNLNINGKLGATGLLSTALDLFYPVGTLYHTESTTFDPNTAWGGEWTLLESGRFIQTTTGFKYSGGSLDNGIFYLAIGRLS